MLLKREIIGWAIITNVVGCSHFVWLKGVHTSQDGGLLETLKLLCVLQYVMTCC